jgi:hypothetical protein
MTSLQLKATKITPEVIFQDGSLNISGASLPEDAVSFYVPLLNWLEEYAKSDFARNSKNKTHFSGKIDYFNTASRGFLLQIIRILNQIQTKGHKVEFHWYYDSDEGLDMTDFNFADLIDDFKLQVQYIGYKE